MNIEGYLRKQAIAEAKANGWLHRNLLWKGQTDAPDDFFAKGGKVVLIEGKSPGKKPRTGQIDERNALKAAGVNVYVCDTIQAYRIALKLPTP